jgi:uncharacterized membrane protein YphA (DoxX/SURF4 family)
VAVGPALVLQGVGYLADWHELTFLTLAIACMTAASGALLLIGYLTPLAGVVAAMFIVGGGLSLYPVPNLYLFQAKLPVAFTAVIAVALVCLGPGAFSLDARLFGRREIIIPSHPPSES